MRAVQATEFGGPDVLVLRDLPQPVPTSGEVLIDVAAADVMFLDAKLRSGWGIEYFPMRPPYVPGGAVAGIVSAVGPEADRSWIGKRVMAPTAASAVGGGLPVGGYAEKALAKAEVLLEVPDQVSLQQAAALVHDGRTAMAAFERGAVGPGNRVLITAAAGGLGTLLIQFAHKAGATVVAAARGRTKLDLVTRLGADTAIDYSEAGWAERVLAATGGAGPTIVFDGAGGELGAAAFGLLAHGGRFVGYGSASGEFALERANDASDRDIDIVGLFDLHTDGFEAGVARVLAQVGAGDVEVVVGQTFPLEKVRDAHMAIEQRTALGRTLLTV